VLPVLRLRVQQVALGRLRLVSYWTAYLKANYPAEYMAALLTSVKATTRTSRRSTWRVPPDGHQGAAARRQRDAELHPGRDDIRFGLGGIRNVGENVVEAIIALAESKGASTDFATSCARSRWRSATSASSSR
jgi:DNA polymerase-3 subunit alpha